MARPAAAVENRQPRSRRVVGAAVVAVRVRDVARARTAVLVPDDRLARQLERDVWRGDVITGLATRVLQSHTYMVRMDNMYR